MCNNIDSYWYVRMPTNPPPAEPEVEMLLELHKEEDAIPEPISTKKDNQLLYRDDCYGSWNKSDAMLVQQIQNTDS